MTYRVTYTNGTTETVHADSYSVPDDAANTSQWVHFLVTHTNGQLIEAARYVRSIREADIATIEAEG